MSIEHDAARRRKQVRDAWGDFLEGHPWDHYATLTFKINTGPDFARRAFNRWVRRLAQDTGLPLFWFVGFEDGHLLGRLHLHALVGNTRDMSPAYMAELWTPGFSRIVAYQPMLGAAHYVAKYVTKELLDYDVSPNFDRAIAARERQYRLGITTDAASRRSPKSH